MARIKLPKKRDYLALRKWLLEYKDKSTENLARLSGISIAKIREWMVYCDVISLKDGDLLKIWVNYKSYSAAESCVILGVTRRAFKCALDKYEIDKYRVKPRPPKPEPTIQLPRTKDEYQELYNKHGKVKIAKMSGLSVTLVERIRYRLGVSSPRTKFIGGNNKHNTIEWLREYYVKQKMSMRKCAKLAGVAPNTIRNWLINHGMVPRPRSRKNATLQAGIA